MTGICVEIGGGRSYHGGWQNFDALTGHDLTPQTEFPIADGTAPIVYSSHCFEHLDDDTVGRMLVEARRMLRPDGTLVIKLPDFELVAERYIDRDAAFFDQWGMGKLVHMWERDTLAARAAMIFCGVWNPEYGDKNAQFSKQFRLTEGAYHGPVPMDDDMRNFAIVHFSPRHVAQAFVAAAPPGWHFNHRNAWNRTEFAYLLDRHGFEVMSQVAADAKTLPIPGIGSQEGISMYFVARPKT